MITKNTNRMTDGAAVNVLDFGAVGDGVADDTAAIQAAMDYAGANSKKLVAEGTDTFRITSTITGTLYVDWDFRGATINATDIPVPASPTGNQTYAVIAEGSISSPAALNSTIRKGDTSVGLVNPATLAAAGITIFNNDLIRVTSDEFYIDGGDVTKRGELLIANNYAADSINLLGATYFGYDFSANIKVEKITPLVAPKIRNVRIICAGAGSVISGLKVSNARELLIEGCYIEGAEDSGIQTFNVLCGSIRNNEIKDCTSPAEGGSGATWNSGYGTVLYECTRSVNVYNNNYINCRRAITGGGRYPTIFINTSRNSARGGKNGFGNHEPNFEWIVSENIVDGVSGIGITVRGQNTIVSKNKIVNFGSVGIYVRNFKVLPTGIFGTQLIDNEIANGGGNGIWLEGDTTGGPINETLISGGSIDDTTFQGILVNQANDLTISNVRIGVINGSGYNIYVLGTALGKCNNVKINNCTISGISSKDGIRANHCNNLQITGLEQQIKPTESTIDLDTCNNVLIDGCYAQTNANDTAFLNAINLDDCNKVIINNNLVEGVAAIANVHGIQLTNSAAGASEDLTITNNIISSCDVAARTVSSGTNYAVMTGNNGRSCANATKFSVAGANNVLANNII